MDRVDYESVIINDLIGYHTRAELHISPWYQRRSVWSQQQKSYLINTLHENKPIPTIYIRHIVDLDSEKSIKEVVDGQQRIRSIIDYKNDHFPAKHPNHKRPIHYSDLSRIEKTHYLQSALSVGYLVGATDPEVIDIFARINSVSKTLNPQERRNARFSGAFKQFSLAEAVSRLSFWRNNAIFTDTQIARMQEVQFISDLIMNLDQGLQDFASPRLDRYYSQHDESYDPAENMHRRLEDVFQSLISLPDGLLRGTIFSTPQLLFSLMIVIDGHRSIKPHVILDCVNDLHSRVEAVRSSEYVQALTTEVFGAFTSGNLHRIRARKLRHDAIDKYFV
ncbi:MAG: DUF262 domain-containing protein [Chloroflexota bacterium]|nr:DUF262 domain-containing protein [Chloroflexota bacterium]